MSLVAGQSDGRVSQPDSGGLPAGSAQLLHEVLPNATTIGLLVNPTNPLATIISKDVEAAARTPGLELAIVPAAASELDKAYSIQRQRHMPNISWPRSRPPLHPSQSRQS